MGPVGLLEALDELVIELDRNGFDELFELLDLGAAHDGSVHTRNRERPSERDLRGLLSNLLGHIDNGVDDVEILVAIIHLLCERIVFAARRIRFSFTPPVAGEKSAG